MPNFYIIAGCNGAGKTTASFTILPEIMNCKEFVNADSIAYGLSPFNVEGVAIEAGKIMLQRINELIEAGEDFAIETTLTARTYVSLINRAKGLGYKVTLLYIWLNSPVLALQRVAQRVKSGGHNIKPEVVERRYIRGIKNLFDMFMPICHTWILVDNSFGMLNPIANKEEFENVIENTELWELIIKQLYDSKAGKY